MYDVLKYDGKKGLNVTKGQFQNFKEAQGYARKIRGNVWHGFSLVIGGQFDPLQKKR